VGREWHKYFRLILADKSPDFIERGSST